MDRNLLRRIPRKLRAKPGRYIALMLMVAISAYCLTSICGSAETLISSSQASAAANMVEDGEFTCLDPLSDDELQHLKDNNVSVEPSFCMDFTLDDGSTLRVSTLRQEINLVSVEDGGALPGEGQVVVERTYAEKKRISVGDTITVGGQSLEVSGLCTSPDYESTLRNLTDPTADPNVFGTAFVTASLYDQLYDSNSSEVTQSYVYAYRLGDGTTNDELVEYLSSLKFDALTAQNEYVRTLAHEKTTEKRELEEGVSQLSSGSQQLESAIGQLQNGLVKLQEASEGASGATSASSDAVANLQKAASELTADAATADKVLSGLGGLEGVNAKMDSTSSYIDTVLENYDKTTQTLSTIVELLYLSLDNPESNPIYQAAIQMQEQFAQGKDGLVKAKSDIDTARKTINDATEGAGSVSELANGMTSKMTQLANGLATFANTLGSLDGSVSQLPGYIGTAVNGNSKILEGMSELARGISELQQRADDLSARVFDSRVNKVATVTSASDNPRVGALAQNQDVFRVIGFSLSLLLLLVISYALAVFVSHTIEEERPIIGAMYALGISRSQMLASYVALPVVLSLVGGIIGTIVGLSPIGIALQIDNVENGFSAPHASPWPPLWVLVCGVVLPPVVAAFVNVTELFRKFNRPVLDLLNLREAAVRAHGLRFLDKLSFTRKFQIRRLIRESGVALTIFVGMFSAILIIMMGVDCYSVCHNLIDDAKSETTWTNLYTYVYPAEEVPEGGTAVFMQNLKISDDGNTYNVTLMGTDSSNPYYDVDPSVGKNKCTISSALAKKAGLEVGDKLVMTNSVTNVDYAFTVDAIVPHESSLYAFMNIESMRELFNKTSTYYNAVFSDKDLDINAQALYSTVLDDDVERAAQQFYDRIRLRMILLMILPVILFAVIMYLMLMVMVDRAAMGISLLKIFGYEENNVRKMYLRTNTFLVILFALIQVPISKLIIDKVFVKAMATTNVAGRFDVSPLTYVLVFVVILVIYTLVNKLLLRRVNKITPNDVLRNR